MAANRPRYKSGPKKGKFMSNRAIAAQKAARKRSGKKKTTKKRTAKKRSSRTSSPSRSTKKQTTRTRSTSTAVAKKKTTKRGAKRRSGGAMNSPNSIWPAVKAAVPVVIGAGAGMVAPAALTRLALKDKDQGLMGYGANAAVSLGGWFLLKKSAKIRKFALPWLVGGMIQLGGRVVREQVPQVAEQLGLGVNALPTPYSGGTMAGVGAVRIETENSGLGVLRVVNG
mgnify:FL=1